VSSQSADENSDDPPPRGAPDQRHAALKKNGTLESRFLREAGRTEK
jgi:hypothetical protein